MRAEEKLLNLIRKKNPVEIHSPVKTEEKSVLSQAKPAVKFDKGVDLLSVLNKFLVLICVGIAGYVGYKYSNVSKQDIKVNVPKVINVQPEVEQNASGEQVIKPPVYYQERLKERNLFNNPWEKDQTQSTVQPVAADADLTRDFNLVGIVLDANPQAIVEDVKAGKTLFLKVGGQIGSSVVKEIKENNIILRQNGQDVELRLSK